MKNSNHFEFWPARLPKSLTVPEVTIFENLEMTTRKYPNKIAFHYYGAPYTYREFFQEVEQLAGYLEKELGIQHQEKVLLFMQNSPQFLISFFAILRLRAVVVPINPMSVTEDLEFYVKDCGIQHGIVGQELLEKVLPLKQSNLLKDLIVAAYSDYISEHHTSLELSSLVTTPSQNHMEVISWNEAINAEKSVSKYDGKNDDIAVIPYTSGTTGLPKGCIHTNQTVQANSVGAAHWMNMTADTVTLTTLPLFHVTGLIHSALTPIYAGGTLVMLTRWDRENAAKAIEEFGCNHWINISTMLIDFLSNPNLENYDISSLTQIGGGGAPLPEAVGEKLYNLTGLRFVEGYGLSETISHTHFNPPDRPKLQCLGIPSFDVDARVIDPESG